MHEKRDGRKVRAVRKRSAFACGRGGLHMQVAVGSCSPGLADEAVLRGGSDEEAPARLGDLCWGDRHGNGSVFRLDRDHALGDGPASDRCGGPPRAHYLCDCPRRPWPYSQAGAAIPRTRCARLRCRRPGTAGFPYPAGPSRKASTRTRAGTGPGTRRRAGPVAGTVAGTRRRAGPATGAGPGTGTRRRAGTRTRAGAGTRRRAAANAGRWPALSGAVLTGWRGVRAGRRAGR
jgi:hypothetical protein